jgi:hypothetical protein
MKNIHKIPPDHVYDSILKTEALACEDEKTLELYFFLVDTGTIPIKYTYCLSYGIIFTSHSG